MKLEVKKLISAAPFIPLQVVDFILRDPALQNLARETVVKTLGEVGFTPEMQERVITKISGGWKMKLALARAMLLNADILLLDGEGTYGVGGEGRRGVAGGRWRGRKQLYQEKHPT